MPKSAEAFRTISEVADDLDVPKHVLRFWEVKFAQIRPMKRGGGRRYYRPEDLELLKGIRHLLHREGYTIKGVQKILREQGIEVVKLQGRGDSEQLAPDAVAAAPPAKAASAPRAKVDGGRPAVTLPPVAHGRDGAQPTQAAQSSRQRLLDPERRSVIMAALKELEGCRAMLRPGSPSATGAADGSVLDTRRSSGTRN